MTSQGSGAWMTSWESNETERGRTKWRSARGLGRLSFGFGFERSKAWAGCDGPWAVILLGGWFCGKMGYPVLLVPDSSPEPLEEYSRGLEMSERFVLCSRGLFRWVRASAPTGCSPRGLGWVVYPFKG
jgi:hypothetical protein